MVKRIANWSARPYVQERKPFQGNNVFGNWYPTARGTDQYIVYSYGEHHPMFVYDAETGVWFENGTRVSRTTSKHRTQLHPHCDTHVLSNDDMRSLVNVGIVSLCSKVVA